MPRSVPSAAQKPWHHSITLDRVMEIGQRPIFFFWTTLIVVFYTQPSHSILVQCIVWLAVVTLLHALSWANRRVAWGAARKVDWADEVVVVTGGSSGLGRVIAETYGMRGASVAVLDVRPFHTAGEGENGESVRWYDCDVGDVNAVARVKDLIEKDLGTPTILINNAGIVNGKPLLSLAPAAVERNFRINLLSHYFTLQAFMPGMLARRAGGTIVTISSVLGHLGASHLSDYTAAKAGLIAMHASLRAELASMASSLEPAPGAKNIRTILVKPGQLSTPLFAGVTTPSNFFGPVVEPVDLAREIVAMVDKGMSGVIGAPFYARWIEWLAVLPYGLQRVVRLLSGVDKAMEGFGRSA